MRSAHAFVICGPTAVGKGCIIEQLLLAVPELWYSVSATTRHPRPGEVEGKNYYFVTPERFDELVAAGGMLEWAQVHGEHRYGTPRQPVTEKLAAGRDVLLELDLAGARQVRESLPQAIQIFVAPPTWQELEARLIGRGTESEVERNRRLQTAKVELAAQDEFDYVIVNDTVAQATAELVQIVRANQ
ncbi:MAG: guanylate kinase [Trueperella sp.]|nr:guanylate kinase [Trueperella sp.]